MKKKFKDSISTPMHPRITLLWIWLFGGAAKEGRGRDGKGGGTDEQHLSDKPLLIHVEKLTVPGSSILPEIVLLQTFNW